MGIAVKKQLRKEMIALLKDMDSKKRSSDEKLLTDKVIEYVMSGSYEKIGVIVSMSHEINTASIIDTLNDEGKLVYSPKCDYETKTMDFYKISSSKDVTTDSKNIPIPIGDEDTHDLDLIIVPGLIYNDEGFRIGYGGGYYDKYLSNYEGQTVSILFDEQLRAFEPDSYDIPVDCLITPTRTLNLKEMK